MAILKKELRGTLVMEVPYQGKFYWVPELMLLDYYEWGKQASSHTWPLYSNTNSYIGAARLACRKFPEILKGVHD